MPTADNTPSSSFDPNLLGAIFGSGLSFFGGLQGANAIDRGGDIAAQGLSLSAAGFRSAASGVAGATNFNLGLQKLNSLRQLEQMSRKFQRSIGQQQTQQAGTGFAIGSKTFLIQRNESLDTFETSVLNLKVDVENKRRSTIFESQLRQTNLENQARAADFKSSSERALAGIRSSAARTQSTVGLLGSALEISSSFSKKAG